MKNIISKFNTLKALVVGDVMLDVYNYAYSRDNRPAPEKPERIAYKISKTKKMFGGAGNVAANLAALGVRTVLLGIEGNHDLFKGLNSGIECHFIQDTSRHTTVKSRLYIDDTYFLRCDTEDVHPVSPDIETGITIYLNEILDRTIDIVILSDYNKGFFTERLAQRIIKECQEKNILTIADFKPFNKDYFKGADIVILNQMEVSQIISNFTQAHKRYSEDLFNILECKHLVITLGKDGICGYDTDGFFYIPGIQIKEIDSCGCGDTVRAVLGCSFRLGLTLKDSAKLANLAGSIVATKEATAVIERQELGVTVELFRKMR